MTEEEKKEVLIKLGLSEEQAEWYLQYDNDIWAVVPTFRLLRRLNGCVEFYRGGYRKWLEKQQAEGMLEKRIPEAAQMLRAGVPAEVIEKFAYDLVLETYEMLLYRLDDRGGAEVDDIFLDEIFDKCSYGKLCEMDADGEPTGRYLFEVHGKIPFSDL
ncbi:MAG: hypothetical protein K2N90_06695 [Lachnospiraceae bacterium]|nr:hypothetical protein [Lachnospiraceae bacterium]